jgi:AraC-like DNA-binding protein
MSRRKRQRMFSREQRKANRAALLANPPSQEIRDRRLLEAEFGRDCGGAWSFPHRTAELWLNARDEHVEHQSYGDRDLMRQAAATMRALERRFQALTGDTLTVEVAENYLEDPRDYIGEPIDS